MTSDRWIEDSSKAAAKIVENVCREQPPGRALAWVGANLYACAMMIAEKQGAEKATTMLFDIFEAVEKQGPLPDYRNLLVTTPKLTEAERRIRARDEFWRRFWPFTLWGAWGGLIAGLVYQGVKHT